MKVHYLEDGYYVNELEKEIKDLKEQVEYQDLWRNEYSNRIDKALEFIEKHNIIGTNKEYLPTGIEKCYSLELMEILKGE